MTAPSQHKIVIVEDEGLIAADFKTPRGNGIQPGERGVAQCRQGGGELRGLVTFPEGRNAALEFGS